MTRETLFVNFLPTFMAVVYIFAVSRLSQRLYHRAGRLGLIHNANLNSPCHTRMVALQRYASGRPYSCCQRIRILARIDWDYSSPESTPSDVDCLPLERCEQCGFPTVVEKVPMANPASSVSREGGQTCLVGHEPGLANQ